MGFWIFMLIIDLLIPVIMIAFGYLFKRSAPKEINSLFGYRTERSMKSKVAWDFAHAYFARLWIIIGWAMLAPSALVMLLAMGKDIDTVASVGLALCLLQCVGMLIPIFPTEAALKRNFDDFGSPRRQHMQ
jgi:uncharacterized membrane protein